MDEISFEQAIDWLMTTDPVSDDDRPVDSNVNRNNEFFFWNVLDSFKRFSENEHNLANICLAIDFLRNEEERIFRGYNYMKFGSHSFNSDFRSEFPWHTSQKYMRIFSHLYNKSNENEKQIIVPFARRLFESRNAIVIRGGGWEESFLITLIES